MLVGDGMGDYPLRELGGRTPLQAARIPNIRRLAAAGPRFRRRARLGVVHRIGAPE